MTHDELHQCIEKKLGLDLTYKAEFQGKGLLIYRTPTGMLIWSIEIVRHIDGWDVGLYERPLKQILAARREDDLRKN